MRLAVVFSLLLLSSCVTYQKCFDKYGLKGDTTRVTVYVPRVDTVEIITPADSLSAFLTDSLLDSLKKTLDTLTVVSESGKLKSKYWYDRYRKALASKTKSLPDTVYQIIKDTARVDVKCPPGVWFDPLEKLPWYSPLKLWEGYKLFAAWALLVAVIAALLYAKIKPTKTVMYVEKDSAVDH